MIVTRSSGIYSHGCRTLSVATVNFEYRMLAVHDSTYENDNATDDGVDMLVSIHIAIT